MDLTQYGPFASIVAIGAALISVFSVFLLKSVGVVSRWTWLTGSTPPFLVTAGARALAVALIATTFILIDKSNYKYFVGGAVLFGILAFGLIAWFDRLTKTYTCKVPLVQTNGAQAINSKGKPIFQSVAVGSEDNMSAAAKKAFKAARKKQPGLSVCAFMSGFGTTTLYNPSAIWPQNVLARIEGRMTVALMGILLCGVMALYLAASSIEMHLRPLAH